MSQHVFYEEEGSFKAGSVLSDSGASLQVESQSGKRSKVKASSVLLRFERPALAEFLGASQQLADGIDADFLWQVCGPDEFGFEALARDYYGHEPSATESAAVAIRLHASPMYFYKKGRGRYRAAPEENLKAALASVERKKRQAEQIAQWVDELGRGVLPEALRSQVHALLFKPDRNAIEVKALEQACAETQLSPARLLAKCGALASPHDYHVDRFAAEYFPAGREYKGAVELRDTSALPLAEVEAFSIDDEGTTEIDDAFSCVLLENGDYRIGVHIAAPALAFGSDSALEAQGAERLSTVYFPGDKITMLPDAVIEKCTLVAGRECAVVSMYLDVAGADFSVRGTHSVTERIRIASNLRIDSLQQRFNAESLQSGRVEGPSGDALSALWRLATQLKALRGEKADDQGDRVDYSFAIEGGHVAIVPRQRGSPIDLVVSELMIFVNATWGKLLADNAVAAIYRTQANFKTRMSLEAAPHAGLGVAQYAWSSSPLRRYVDLVNQRQLIALIHRQPPPFPRRSPRLLEIARRFELTYDAYNEFQRGMERYWVLRYFEQEGMTRFLASVIREDLVRAETLPFITRVPGMPAHPPGTRVWIGVSGVDFWEPGATYTFLEPFAAGEPVAAAGSNSAPA
jgi:exoribonuclease-2